MEANRRSDGSGDTDRRCIEEQPLIRALFTANAAAYGRIIRTGYYRPSGPPGQCWSNAWKASHSHQWQLWEGVVSTDHGLTWNAHAWCVDAVGKAVETTVGHNAVTHYRGWQIDRRAAVLVAANWHHRVLTGELRSSVIETWLALFMRVNGAGPEHYWRSVLASVTA